MDTICTYMCVCACTAHPSNCIQGHAYIYLYILACIDSHCVSDPCKLAKNEPLCMPELNQNTPKKPILRSNPQGTIIDMFKYIVNDNSTSGLRADIFLRAILVLLTVENMP